MRCSKLIAIVGAFGALLVFASPHHHEKEEQKSVASNSTNEPPDTLCPVEAEYSGGEGPVAVDSGSTLTPLYTTLSTSVVGMNRRQVNPVGPGADTSATGLTGSAVDTAAAPSPPSNGGAPKKHLVAGGPACNKGSKKPANPNPAVGVDPAAGSSALTAPEVQITARALMPVGLQPNHPRVTPRTTEMPPVYSSWDPVSSGPKASGFEKRAPMLTPLNIDHPEVYGPPMTSG